MVKFYEIRFYIDRQLSEFNIFRFEFNDWKTYWK